VDASAAVCVSQPAAVTACIKQAAPAVRIIDQQQSARAHAAPAPDGAGQTGMACSATGS
jgi:hypothetical protein